MKGRVTVLGCGNSAGVPLIGNEWGRCDPAEPKNRRRRPSVHIEVGGKGLQIDTGPDLKDQINSFNIKNIDCVFYTHDHADHTQGIDDMRLWVTRQEKKIPTYSDPVTLESLTRRFGFIFKEESYRLYPLVMIPQVIETSQYGRPFDMAGIPATVFEQDHGRCTSLGIRVGDFAYSTDFIRLPQDSIDTLKGVKTWIADAAAYHSTKNSLHAALHDVIALNEQIGAAQVYLTHMPVSMDYQTLLTELPSGFAPAYDGLTLDITVD